MTRQKSVYIIILNWNRFDDTFECLSSLEKLENNGYTLSVVVVDNGSKDDSVLRLKKFKTDKFKLEVVNNKNNLGFAAGNNVGINIAMKNKCDYILLLNNDTVVDTKLLNELLAASNKYKTVGIFTPKIYFAKGFEFHKRYEQKDLGRVIWSFGGKIDWDNMYASNANVNVVDNISLDHDSETEFATGAGLFVTVDVMRKLKGFDERYYLYFEDVDLCQRYKIHGGKIMALNKAKLWHKVSQSSAIGSELNDYYITRNRLLFGMKYASLRTKLALLRESLRFILNGRKWQKIGVKDFFLNKFMRGSWK